MIRQLVDGKRAARYLDVEFNTFNEWRKDGKFPPVPLPVVIRGRAKYVVAELDNFIREHMSLRGSPPTAK